MHRWCAWDSNAQPYDGRHRRNHGAMAATIKVFLLLICGQSYKQFTLVIYDPRVVIWSVFQSGPTLES